MEQDIKEKKVEYLELVYDLIFVFSFRRNMTLMRIITDGFVTKAEFLAYFLCTMAVIQIWNFSTHYINLYGKNSLRNHVYLFVNMFLLYFMGVGEKARGQEFQIRHHAAWGLIILNTAVQYALELRNYRDDPQHQSYIKRMITVLGAQSVLILATFRTEGIPAMLVSCLFILCGVIAGLAVGKGSGIRVDFMHLTERVMLLVVLTFGEMIIALTDYFDGSISLNNIYFA
ncbi:MAG: low temperature requirement protein A, partial [Anaerolineaceae bacterium]|nr:low temperature requirement protein A [Anaerolineaceae bacterium]